MELPYSGGIIHQLDITCYQIKSPVSGNDCNILSHWLMDFNRPTPQTIEDIANATDYPTKVDNNSVFKVV